MKLRGNRVVEENPKLGKGEEKEKKRKEKKVKQRRKKERCVRRE